MTTPPDRELRFLALCCLAGAIAAALVYLGTGFMDSFLYALNDPYAIHLVAFTWFAYAAVPTYVCGWVIRKLARPRA